VRSLEVCGGQTYTSTWSATFETSVVPGVGGPAAYVPAAAHVGGAANTNWRTDLETHNPGLTTASFALALLKRDQGNEKPLLQSFSLPPGTSRRFGDVLQETFAFTGAATLRLEPLAGSLLAIARTYNDQATGTFGQFIPGALESSAITYGQAARLVQLAQALSQATGFRTNIGFVNVTAAAITVEVKGYLGDGTLLGTKTIELRPYEFKQVDKLLSVMTSLAIDDAFVQVRTTTAGGAFFAYASVIDNRSGDPIFIPAQVVTPSGP
jgi:hypothetical protein